MSYKNNTVYVQESNLMMNIKLKKSHKFHKGINIRIHLLTKKDKSMLKC